MSLHPCWHDRGDCGVHALDSRYGTSNEEGVVAAMNRKDTAYVRRLLDKPVRELEVAGIGPSAEHLDLYSQRPDMRGASFSQVSHCRTSAHMFLCCQHLT